MGQRGEIQVEDLRLLQGVISTSQSKWAKCGKQEKGEGERKPPGWRREEFREVPIGAV